jgi:maltooligosyltrehalose trehalohydrolase
MTAPFVPMLFQGEEWDASAPFPYFSDHGDPDLAEAVREGRRAEFSAFGWEPDEIPDPQDSATFERPASTGTNETIPVTGTGSGGTGA